MSLHVHLEPLDLAVGSSTTLYRAFVAAFFEMYLFMYLKAFVAYKGFIAYVADESLLMLRVHFHVLDQNAYLMKCLSTFRMVALILALSILV